MNRDPETCPTCGGHMVGDGHMDVRHCEIIDVLMDIEADAGPFYCCSRYNPDQHSCHGCVQLSTEAECKACIEG
jgi:hypothetical protein